ncbi:MAG: hypothetical protein K6T31_10070, partial [Alicyclobacillus sp.]|nr:hypothetical protein [Alicyclobacillus sp.]
RRMDSTVLNDIVTIVGTTLTVLAGLFGLNKRWPLLSKAVAWFEQDGPTLIQDVGKVARDLEQSPFWPKPQTSGEAPATVPHPQWLQTELGRVALVGLHAFGDALDQLSDDQKKALAFYIASRVPGVTPTQIDQTLAAMQREADVAAKSALFQSANAFTEAQKSLNVTSSPPAVITGTGAATAGTPAGADGAAPVGPGASLAPGTQTAVNTGSASQAAVSGSQAAVGG